MDSECFDTGLGHLRDDGYRRMWSPSHRGHVYVHRYIYEQCFGPIPDDMQVLHRCDNRQCAMPDHLYLGTDADNVRDREKRNRNTYRKGTKHHASKLTDEQVLAIRAEYDAGGTSQRKLAAKYGVAQRTIARIVNSIGWTHV